MTEIFYTTRGMHWCNTKNRDESRGVNHSQHMLPFKRAYVDSPRARWWRDRKLEIARVARAHTAHTSDSTHSQITTWQIRTRWSMRHRESATTPFVRLHPNLEPYGVCGPVHEHTRHRPCHAGLDAVQCDTVRRGGSGLGNVARDGGGRGGL